MGNKHPAEIVFGMIEPQLQIGNGVERRFKLIRRFMCNISASPFGSSFTVQGGPSQIRGRMSPPDVTEACLNTQGIFAVLRSGEIVSSVSPAV